MIVPASQAIPAAPAAQTQLFTIILQRRTNNHHIRIIFIHEQSQTGFELNSHPSRHDPETPEKDREGTWSADAR